MGEGLLAPSHLVVLALVALVLFGPKRLPELGRSLGLGLRGFREGIASHPVSDDAESEPSERPLPRP